MIRFVPGKSGVDSFHNSVKKIRSKSYAESILSASLRR